MINTVPIPKEYKYRIICTNFINGRKEFKAEYDCSYPKVHKGLFFTENTEIIDYWKTVEYYHGTLPMIYLTREDALKAIDKHFGSKENGTQIEYIIKQL